MADLQPMQRESVAYRVIEGRAALIIPEDLSLCRLNAVATKIWELCDGANTTQQIAAHICDEYVVDYETAIRDVEQMTLEFARRHLVCRDGLELPWESDESQPAAVPYQGEQGRPVPSPWTELSTTANDKCIPLQATVELTLRCNLACAHCYNFDREIPYTRERVEDELTADEILGIIDQLAQSNCLFLWFTGGEAMLHPRLADFVRHAYSRRFSVGIKTNGTVLTPANVRTLSEAGARHIHISLYGATPKTHDEFTGRPGSYQKSVDGIKLARAAGLIVKINMSVTQSNAGEVGELIEMAEAMGCSVGINPYISARYDGTTSSRDHQADRDTLKALYLGAMNTYMGKPNFDPEASIQCGCARGLCGISATGVVYPCIGAPVPSGNLRENSFREIWDHSPQFMQIRSLVLEDFKVCKPCPDRPYCGRNSGFVFANTGNYTGPEQFTCMDAGARREVMEGVASPPRPIPAAALQPVGKLWQITGTLPQKP